MNTTTRVSQLTLALGLGFASLAGAQSAPTAASDDANHMHALADGQVSSNAPEVQPKTTPPPHPGDRNCLQTTGSLIPAKPGHCLATSPGSSYSRQDILNTGHPNTGAALRDLDPRITVSGGH